MMVALLTATALGLTVSAVAETQDTVGGDGNQQAAETPETERQRRNERRQANRSEQRERRQRDSIGVDDSDTAETDRTNRQQRREQRRAERSERRKLHQDSADRGEAGQNTRRRDQRNHRQLNRRDFGHVRSDRRKVAHKGRWDGERPRAKHQAFDDRVDLRMSKLRARTRSGLENGEVTHRELKRIRKDQRKIARMDRHFGSDGRYTKRERRKLNRSLDRASNRVYRAKHNNRVAGDARKRRW
jgi:hypothetical protein